MQAFTKPSARVRRAWFWSATAAVVTGAVLFTGATRDVEAHKAKTSPFSYNIDIFPILRDKCGRCHAEGGPAPMSLMTYDTNGGAVAWAESIREMLLAGAMPPYYADPAGPAVRNPHSLTPRETDMIITWATGGTPHGDLTKKPPAVTAPQGWSLGAPDLELPMEQPFSLPGDSMQAHHEVTLATKLTEARWVKAVDLKPGTVTMVRRAVIALEHGPVLAVWEPGDETTPAPNGTGFKLPAGARLTVGIDYRKSWQDEQKNVSDRSVVGLYFTDEPMSGRAITSAQIEGPSQPAEDLSPRTVTGTLTQGGRIVGLRPSVDIPYAQMSIDATFPNGRKATLLKLRGVRPEWPRRYWLVDPVEVPANTKIEVSLVPGDPDIGPLLKAAGVPLQVGFDIIPQ